jgi:hypothetical protein
MKDGRNYVHFSVNQPSRSLPVRKHSATEGENGQEGQELALANLFKIRRRAKRLTTSSMTT